MTVIYQAAFAGLVAGGLLIAALILGKAVVVFWRLVRSTRRSRGSLVSQQQSSFDADLREAVENPSIERLEDPHHADTFQRDISLNTERYETDVSSPVGGRIMRDGRYRRLSSGSSGRKKDQDFRRPGPS